MLCISACSLVYGYDDYVPQDAGASVSGAGGSSVSSSASGASGGAGGEAGSGAGAAGGAAGCGGTKDLLGWYVASDITDHAPGDEVILWRDATGNGHDLEATVFAPTWEPTGIAGKPVVRFNGTDAQPLSATFPLTELGGPNVSLTVFAVVDATSLAAEGRAVWAYGEPAANDDGMFLEQNDGGVFFWSLTGGSMGAFNKAESVGGETLAPVVWTAAKGATEMHLHKSGKEVGSVLNGTPIDVAEVYDVFVLGNRNKERAWSGDMAEVLVYAGLLSKADRKAIEACLGLRYGITIAP